MAKGMEMFFGVEEVGLVLPIETSRRNSGVRQPVERDVVEEVVNGVGAGGMPLDDLLDQARLAGTVAVVEHEGGEIDG